MDSLMAISIFMALLALGLGIVCKIQHNEIAEKNEEIDRMKEDHREHLDKLSLLHHKERVRLNKEIEKRDAKIESHFTEISILDMKCKNDLQTMEDRHHEILQAVMDGADQWLAALREEIGEDEDDHVPSLLELIEGNQDVQWNMISEGKKS